MKKILTALLIMTLIFSVSLVGCSESGQKASSSKDVQPSETNKDEQKQQVLRLMCWDKEANQTPYLDLFKKKFPDIKVEVQVVENTQYDNVLNTQLAAGEGPDIMELGAQTKSLANAGYLEDLTSAPFTSKYYESGLSPFKDKGKNYAIPNLSWFEGIFYNKKIFAKYSLKPPKSFDEWMQIHETLKKAGVKPQTMGAKSWEPMLKQSIGLLLNEFYPTDAGKTFDEAFNTGAMTMDGNWNSVVKKWSEIVQKGYLQKDMLGLDYDQALDEFAMEKAAMWECGPWATEALKKKNPNLELGMFPIPGVKEGIGWLLGGPGSAWAINVNAKNKDSAMDLLELVSTPEVQIAINKVNSGSSFMKGVKLEMGPEYADSSEAIAAGNIYCPWNNWFGAQTIITEYGKGMQEFLAGTMTIDDVLKTTDKKAAEVRKNQK